VIFSRALVLRSATIGLFSATALTVVPFASADPHVLLGSAIGDNSVGYGTERPAKISLGSCANAIDDIAWDDWGGPVAHGAGTACRQSGTPPRYSLVASEIGMCNGQIAYRTLQISTNDPQSICE
jgi:hypothetical protein